MERLVACDVSAGKLDQFLDYDPSGIGSIRDRIAADMANDLLAAMGQPASQTAADVRRVRLRGNWTTMDRRPPE